MILNKRYYNRIFLTFFFVLAVHLQVFCQMGLSISFSNNHTIGSNILIKYNKDEFYLGFDYQSNGQKHTVVNERKKTYGLTPISNGNYFWLINFGYCRFILKPLSIQSEISIGPKYYFTNFKDNRFTDDGYSLINRTESIVGAGLGLGYQINRHLEPYIGIHTIKKFMFGVKIFL